jgi:tetratricopeptide (TPR) repeat protein
MLLLVPLFLALSVIFAHGENGGVLLTEAVQLRLADAFMAEGEYYRAITEYKKLLILFPDSKQTDYARFRIAMAYYRGEEYESAARAFAAFQERHPRSGYAAEAGFYEGVSYLGLNSPGKAENAFTRVATASPDSEYGRRALLGTSLIRFDRNDTAGCRRQLERYLVDYPADDRREHVRDAIGLLERNREPARKSPLAAGILSAVVPGSGHVYAGHYGDGITSLFLNGLFIAGTVMSVKQENYAVAGIVGTIGVPFYIGNIYGAANAATKYNLGIRNDLRRQLSVTLDFPF